MTKRWIYISFLFLTLLFSCKGKKETAQTNTTAPSGFPNKVQIERQLKSQFIDAKKEKIIGNLTKAKQIFEQVLANDPTCSACAFELAEIAIKEQNARVALSMTEMASKAEPNNKFYKEQRAEVIYMLGDAKQAASISKTLIDSFPKARDHYTRTIFYYEKALMYPEAKIVLDLYKQQFGFTYQTAMMYDYLYDMNKNADGKIENWAALIAKYPNDVGYRSKYINALIDVGNYTNAENEITVLDGKVENRSQNYLMRAKIYSLQKDWARYISNLTLAAKDSVLESSIKVQYLVRSEEIKDTAILIPIKLIAKDEPAANDYLLFYQKQFGQTTSEVEELELKYKAFPNDKSSAEMLVDAYTKRNRFTDALEITKLLVGNNPSLVEYYILHAKTLMHNGEFADAYSYADQGLIYAIDNNETAKCFLQMAFANFYLGKKENVKVELEKAWAKKDNSNDLAITENLIYLSLVNDLFIEKVKAALPAIKDSYMNTLANLYQASNYSKAAWQALYNLNPTESLIKEAWVLKAKKEGAKEDVVKLKNELKEQYPNHSFYKNI